MCCCDNNKKKDENYLIDTIDTQSNYTSENSLIHYGVS